jgi:hypothetical protein
VISGRPPGQRPGDSQPKEEGTAVKNIIEIAPATPGWYARWRLTPEHTRTFPVAVWALVEDDGSGRRQVVGVDSAGQWPGGFDNEPGWDFVRFIFEPLEAGQPDDLFNPVQSPSEPVRR